MNRNKIFKAFLMISVSFVVLMSLFGTSVNATDVYYVYAGGSTSNNIQKFLASDLSYQMSSETYGGTIKDMIVDGNYIFVGGSTGYIKKYLRSDLSLVATSPSAGSISDMHIVGSYIYILTGVTLKKYRTSDLSYVATASSNPSASVKEISDDGTEIIGVGSFGSTGGYFRWTMSTMTYLGVSGLVSLPFYGGTLYSVTKCGSYQCVFTNAASGTLPHNIWKFDNTGLNSGGDDDVGSNVYAQDTFGNYIYASSSTKTIQKYGFPSTGSKYVGQSTSFGSTVYDITHDNSYLYAGGNSGYIKKYSTSPTYLFTSSQSYGGTIYALETGLEPEPIPPINITSWNNNYTNDNSTELTYPLGNVINFSIITNYGINSVEYSCGGGTVSESSYSGTNASFLCTYVTTGNYYANITVHDISGYNDTTTWNLTIEPFDYYLKYVYVVGETAQTINKYYKNMTFVESSPSYGSNILSISQDDNYVYAGGSGGYIKKYLKSNMSYVSSSPYYGGNILSISQDDNYVYAGGNIGYVKKYLKSNMSYVSSSPYYGGALWTLETHGNYTYAGGSITNTIKKYLSSNLSLMSESPSYGGTITSLESDSEFIYAAGTGSGKNIKKYSITDLSYVSSSPYYGGSIWTLIADETYIYAGGLTTNKVRKYFKSNMSYVSESPSYGSSIYALSIDSLYIYAGGDALYKDVKKYRKSDMSYIGNTTSYGGKINEISTQYSYSINSYYMNIIGWSNSVSHDETLEFITINDTEVTFFAYSDIPWTTGEITCGNGNYLGYNRLSPNSVEFMCVFNTIGNTEAYVTLNNTYGYNDTITWNITSVEGINIINYGNNYTNNTNTSMNVPINSVVNFNVTSDLEIDNIQYLPGDNGTYGIYNANITYLFDTVGTYSKYIKVFDSYGGSDTQLWNVTVFDDIALTSLNNSYTGNNSTYFEVEIGESITFTMNTSEQITSYYSECAYCVVNYEVLDDYSYSVNVTFNRSHTQMVVLMVYDQFGNYVIDSWSVHVLPITIESWQNDYTNDNSLNLSIIGYRNIIFNVTTDNPVTTWDSGCSSAIPHTNKSNNSMRLLCEINTDTATLAYIKAINSNGYYDLIEWNLDVTAINSSTNLNYNRMTHKLEFNSSVGELADYAYIYADNIKVNEVYNLTSESYEEVRLGDYISTTNGNLLIEVDEYNLTYGKLVETYLNVTSTKNNISVYDRFGYDSYGILREDTNIDGLTSGDIDRFSTIGQKQYFNVRFANSNDSFTIEDDYTGETLYNYIASEPSEVLISYTQQIGRPNLGRYGINNVFVGAENTALIDSNGTYKNNETYRVIYNLNESYVLFNSTSVQVENNDRYSGGASFVKDAYNNDEDVYITWIGNITKIQVYAKTPEGSETHINLIRNYTVSGGSGSFFAFNTNEAQIQTLYNRDIISNGLWTVTAISTDENYSTTSIADFELTFSSDSTVATGTIASIGDLQNGFNLNVLALFLASLIIMFTTIWIIGSHFKNSGMDTGHNNTIVLLAVGAEAFIFMMLDWIPFEVVLVIGILILLSFIEKTTTGRNRGGGLT